MSASMDRLWKGRGIWLWILLLGLLGAGGIVAFRMISTLQNPTVEETAPVPQQVTVAALGRLEPRGEVIRVGGPVGERIGRLEVAEGDYVKTGDALAYLESYEERLAERNYASSQVTEAQAQLRTETQFGSAQIQEAQTRIEQIDRPQRFEIQAQQATVRQLEAELELAQVDLERSQGLQVEGAISRQDLDNQLTEVRQRQEALNNAKATLVQLESERNSNLRNAEAQVVSQRANLSRSQAQVELDSATRNLQMAEAKLERTIIRAPSDGEILRIHTLQGEAISDQGSILEMGDTRQMYVVAEVYETDVGMVTLGQQATITSRNGAFDETLSGTVERIGSQIFKNDVLDDDPAANADARVVEVRIRLDQSEPVEKLTNLQVDVRIDVEG
jgi:HlyD family secretion protein